MIADNPMGILYVATATKLSFANFESIIFTTAEKLRGKLHIQTFVTNLSRNLSYFLLNPYLNSAILNFYIKKFYRHAKKHENYKTFLPRNFHGIRYSISCPLNFHRLCECYPSCMVVCT